MVNQKVSNVKLNMDMVAYTSKPDAAMVVKRLKCPKAVATLSIEDVAKKLGSGYTMTCGVLHGTKGSDWKEQQVFAWDVDNDNASIPQLTPHDVDIILAAHGIPVAFTYETFNSTTECPRFRVVCVCDEVVTDPRVATTILKNVASLFVDEHKRSQVDQACFNLDRMFYGTTKGTSSVSNLAFSVSTAMSIDNPLDLHSEYEKFDLVNYIASEFNLEPKKGRGSDVMFSPCPLCGHNEDFFVNTEKNVFKCHSSHGGKSGNILNFLMESKKLTKKEAREYFVNNLLTSLTEVEKKQIVPDLNLIDGNTLLKTDWGKVNWYIQGILHEGLCVMASMPKLGKSILVLDMLIHIATGREIWGKAVKKCDVLYMALEDSHRRLKDRIMAMTTLDGGFRPDLSGMHFATTARSLDEGFIKQIDNYMTLYPNTGIIAIDILQRVRGSNRDGRNAYEFDIHEMAKLKNIADKYKIAVIVVHHDSKMKQSTDMVNAFSGSRGIVGTADLLMALFTVPDNTTQAKLMMKSRETESQAYLLSHATSRLGWDMHKVVDFSDDCTKTSSAKTNEIQAWLRKRLEKGPELVSVVIDDARDAGYSQAAIYRARPDWVQTKRDGKNGVARYWYIDDSAPEPSNELSDDEMFTKLYGPTPKVKAAVTTNSVRLQGINSDTMQLYIDRWKTKGIIVEAVPNPDDSAQVAYIIKQL